MHSSIKHVRRITAAFLMAFAGACGVSQQQEVELGASTAQQVAAQLPMVRDGASLSYITALGNRLVNATDNRGLAWHFNIVDSREINAFAVPGGWIYINRGLIEKAGTMSELAGVLAHEIGHVTRRHSVQQMQQAQGANVGLALACTLTRFCESGASRAAINVGGSALFAKFSRSDEREADAEAVTTTIRAGISPLGIPVMFQTLLNERKNNPSRLDMFFSTHPMEESRITNTRNQINTYSPGEIQGLTRDTQEFQNFKRRLMSLPAPRR